MYTQLHTVMENTVNTIIHNISILIYINEEILLTDSQIHEQISIKNLGPN